MTQRETVRHWIDAAAHIAVLTGAGVSAESGEPTFRDAQTRLWAQFNPEDLATEAAFRAHPQRVWDWCAVCGNLRPPAPVIIINPEPTELDQVADACLREPAAQCLPLLLELP